MVFKSAVDTWFYAALAASVVIVMIALSPLLVSGDAMSAGVALVAAALPIGLPLWLLYTTDYTVGKGLLLIRSGPFHWSIPLNDIRSVSPSRSWLSSPALSLNRLEIRYGGDRRILVSPADREGFLRAIGQSLR